MYSNGETVIRQRATPVEDPYSGEPIGLDWDNPNELDLEGCAIWPGSANEIYAIGRNSEDVELTVAAPSGSDVKRHDRIVVRGEVFEVDGTPWDYKSPLTGWTPGLIIELKITNG